MFNVEDYFTLEDFIEGSFPLFEVDLSFNEKKFAKDIKKFTIILQRLEQLIGPYIIEVNLGEINIKQKKE